jgi:hypothetical protein
MLYVQSKNVYKMSTIQPTSQLWVTAAPTAGGPGDHVVTVEVDKHTGRKGRTARLIWYADFLNAVEREIQQAGEDEYAKFDQKKYSIPATGGSITIKGKSNSKSLYFILANAGKVPVQLSNNYTAAGMITGNGSNIIGDPGQYAEYSFSLPVTIQPNNSDGTIATYINVYGYGGPSLTRLDTCTIIQQGKEESSFIEVEKKTIELPASGGLDTIIVNSNTNWTLEIKV